MEIPLKTVFINRYFYPDHSATSQLLTDVAFNLADKDVDVCVFTSRQTYNNPSAKLLSSEKIQGIQICRVWTSQFGRGRLLGRALDYLTFYFSTGWHLLWNLAPGDIVVAKTDPPLISVVAAVIAKIHRATLVNWTQDLFPEVAATLGIKGMNGWFGRYLRWLRNASLKYADCNIVLGHRMAARLIEQGIPRNRIKIIHNWSDGEAIQPIRSQNNRLRHEWKLERKFVVGYSGNMGRSHEFETILNAAEILNSDENILFLFIGGGAKRDWIEQEVGTRGLTNVIFKPYQERETLRESLTVPDVHLISLLPELEGYIVPSKFYGIAAAGRPTVFIGDPEGEIPCILLEEECGFTVRPKDDKSLADHLRELKKNRKLCEHFGSNARAVFERRFDKPLALRVWHKVLKGAHQK